MKIRLEPVTVASRAAVERLETAPGQEGFVESVAECLAEADRRRCWRPVGVYDGDALIGFAMYGFFWEYLPFGRLWLDRLLIDRRFQGRGYGRAALAALLERLEREYHKKRIYLSVVEANRPAAALYESFGFRFTGERDTHGERVMCLAHPLNRGKSARPLLGAGACVRETRPGQAPYTKWCLRRCSAGYCCATGEGSPPPPRTRAGAPSRPGAAKDTPRRQYTMSMAMMAGGKTRPR